jgi:hypothetical protein
VAENTRRSGLRPSIKRPLSADANRHDDEPLSITAASNTVPHGIGTSGRRIGPPDAVNPAGRKLGSAALESEDEGEGDAGGAEGGE